MRSACLHCTFIALSLISLFAEEPRVWTNAEDQTLTATLVDFEGEDVQLRLESGKTYTISINTLSTKDQEYLASWKAEKEAAAAWDEVDLQLGVPTEPVVISEFSEDAPPTRKGMVQGWKAGIGEWRVENGSLIGDELPEDDHASSLTFNLEATDLIITAQVKLGEAEQITFACRDTVPPNLHLGRLYVTADKLWIQRMSGIAKSTQAVRLVEEEVDLDPDTWYDVTIEIIGDRYRAKVGRDELEAQHERFADAKGIIALVNRGKGAHFRNVSVWKALPKDSEPE